MEKKRILYVSQEIDPYLSLSEIAKFAISLPKKMNELGHEVRVFMPRFGVVNERRHQLHEVIRLSGMNIVINDMDQPLIIKVASVPGARIQVYFIDNDDYFKRKTALYDGDNKLHKDNDERTVFFAKGIIETVKKLGWSPDIIHMHGWMTSMLPMYLRELNKENPLFDNSKLVCSVYNNAFEGALGDNLVNSLKYDGIENGSLKNLETPDFISLYKTALNHSDAVVAGCEDIHEDILKHITELNLPLLGMPDASDPMKVVDFYENVVVEESIA
ncbi:MAG: glycogen/starch synthase [Schleiferiaceae bacterium]|nr:glycogen/starch synthase [Schleiferiaceae bacterium]